ncbi:MAG: NUDIX hydrolase [Gammaproteobacteria bacterium]|nr:MAG: NUDIX hydrolase [Gammaproteobacteria bacterium]
MTTPRDAAAGVAVATPRDAASVLLYRRRASGVDVLLGRRASSHRFMPDVYVFPGGAVDADDADACAIGELSASSIAALAVKGDAREAHALAMAGIRETFEEAGLLIGEACITDSLRRDACAQPASESWQTIAASGLVPTLDPLWPVARAITPESEPIRFHARFFGVDVDTVATIASTEPRGNGELLDLRWFDAAEPGEIRLAGVTRFVLSELLRQLDADDDKPQTRMYTRIDGKPVIS